MPHLKRYKSKRTSAWKIRRCPSCTQRWSCRAIFKRQKISLRKPSAVCYDCARCEAMTQLNSCVLFCPFTDGLMDTYLANQDYKATWSLQETVNSEKRPGMRGGHQLIIDSANSVMYLYGGWDGYEDLSDLWSYSIKRNSWTLIHDRSEDREGPSPRSCHKMVYDPHNSQIFTLGRYMDSTTRTMEHIKV